MKDETDPAALSLSGARLLQLLEPFLASLVPQEVTPGSLIMYIIGVLAPLDLTLSHSSPPALPPPLTLFSRP